MYNLYILGIKSCDTGVVHLKQAAAIMESSLSEKRDYSPSLTYIIFVFFIFTN